jgi:hypothetical protein
MAAQASWACKLPTVNDSASFEIAYVTSAQVALESDELFGSGSPRIIVTVPLYGAYLAWCESWRRPTPRC